MIGKHKPDTLRFAETNFKYYGLLLNIDILLTGFTRISSYVIRDRGMEEPSYSETTQIYLKIHNSLPYCSMVFWSRY